jgi:hypothetical protein
MNKDKITSEMSRKDNDKQSNEPEQRGSMPVRDAANEKLKQYSGLHLKRTEETFKERNRRDFHKPQMTAVNKMFTSQLDDIKEPKSALDYLNEFIKK